MNLTEINGTDHLKLNTTCFQLQILGVVCLCLGLCGIMFNSVLLYICLCRKEMRNSINSFMIVLTFLNLVGCLTEMPFIVISNFSCRYFLLNFNSLFDDVNKFPQLRWPFGKIGCDLTATLMFFIGCTSVYMLVAISLQRYYIIRKPLNIKKITKKATLIVIGICCASGLIWSLLPLFGWSSYVLEGSLTSCGPDFHSKTFNNLSFNITLFLTVFVIPFCIIAVTSFKLYIKVMNYL